MFVEHCLLIAAVYRLPAIHQDPFDRALIAQAMVEEFALVTTDRTIPQYASGSVRVVA
jgi:PIN domain nuclease of toxin-antitoxin system